MSDDGTNLIVTPGYRYVLKAPFSEDATSLHGGSLDVGTFNAGDSGYTSFGADGYVAGGRDAFRAQVRPRFQAGSLDLALPFVPSVSVGPTYSYNNIRGEQTHALGGMVRGHIDYINILRIFGPAIPVSVGLQVGVGFETQVAGKNPGQTRAVGEAGANLTWLF